MRSSMFIILSFIGSMGLFLWVMCVHRLMSMCVLLLFVSCVIVLIGLCSKRLSNVLW